MIAENRVTLRGEVSANTLDEATVEIHNRLLKFFGGSKYSIAYLDAVDVSDTYIEYNLGGELVDYTTEAKFTVAYKAAEVR